MFGAFKSPGEDPEHDLIPPLKLIDFGDARDLNEPRERQDYLMEYNEYKNREIKRRETRALRQAAAMDKDGDVTMVGQDEVLSQKDRSQDEVLGEDDLYFASPEREPMGDNRGTAKNIYDIGKVS